MDHKRVTLFAGHYGSGKTNIAVSYALLLAREGKKTAIADLDIVNPYFRTKDSASELEAAGVTVLSNECTVLERGGGTLVLAGGDDPNGYADQKTPEALAEEIRSVFGDPFWLLLAHRNNYFERTYSRLGADLVITGHGHGGLIRLPFTDGLVSVERTFFPSYTAGFYSANGGELFVSRGLGNNTVPFQGFRLFNRPELAVVTLMRG